MPEPTDFASAVRAILAEERRRAVDHPETPEIVGYTSGTLPVERADALREHFAVCRECADLVYDGAELTAAPPAGPAQAAEVAAAYRDVRRRLGLGFSAEATPPVPTRPARTPIDRALPWLLAAATLAAVAIGIWGWREHRALAGARTPRVNVADVDLEPEGSDQVRGEVPSRPVDLAAGATLFLSLPGVTVPQELQVSIVDDRGRVLWAIPGARPDPLLGNLSLHLPPASLPPGRYQIRVTPSAGGSALVSYALDVR